MGYSHYLLSRYEKAIECYEQALTIYREIKDQTGVGIALNNLGQANRAMSRYEQAIEYYEQALALRREMKDASGEGVTLNYLGNVYRLLSRNEKAIEYFKQSLAIMREVKNRAVEGGALHNLGVAYHNLSRHEQAIQYFTQALTIRREVKDRAGEATTLQYLARAESALGNTAAAQANIEESLKISESLRADVSSAQSRTSFLATAQSGYQLYTELLMRQHRAEPTKGFDALALENSERQRARSLLDLLAESHTDLRQGVNAALLEREKNVAQQLNHKAQQLAQAPKAEHLTALKQDVSQLEIELERAQAAIRKANPS